jgi:transcriptional regulator GlxA family with amidase domain
VRFDLVVFDGVDELDAIGPLSVLRRAAGEDSSVEVRLVHLAGAPSVIGAGGLRFFVDVPLQVGGQDVLIVPGGGWAARSPLGAYAEAAAGRLPPALAACAQRTNLLASVCTGALLLAHAGLVAGRRMSTHHTARAELAGFGAIVMDDRVVDDGDLVSCGGVTSGIDLALWLVERELGASLAEQVATRLEYERQRPLFTP